MMHDVQDKLGTEIRLGDTIVKPYTSGRSAMIEICKVTNIDDLGRIFLDNRKQHVRCPERCLVIDPAINKV